jgi:hypothetical protein
MQPQASSPTTAPQNQVETDPLPTRAEPAFPFTLEHFDQLPHSALVRQPVVEELFACPSTTFWKPPYTGGPQLSGRRFDVEALMAALRQGVQA